MLTFWLIVALMTVLALALVIIPLLRSEKKTSINRELLYVALYKDRAQALQQQYTNSVITFEDYQQSKDELDVSLLQDLPERAKERVNAQPSKKLALFLALIFPCAAFAVYWHLGNSREVSAWLKSKQQAAIVQAEIKQLGSVDNIINALKQRLVLTPTSATGWYLLGKLYFSQQQYPESVDALAKANQFKPQDPEILSQYAQSLFFLNNRHITPATKAILFQLLKFKPDDVNAINLLALGAYRDGDYQTAINYWQRLLSQFPQNSADANNLLQMIALAQQHLPRK